MILPYLSGILKPLQIPITWLLVLVNVIFFFTSYDSQVQTETAIESFFENSNLERAQGLIYAEFIQQNPGLYSDLYFHLSDSALKGQEQQIDLLSKLALRDKQFITMAPKLKTVIDPVQFDFWKKEFNRILAVEDQDLSYSLGLDAIDTKAYQWVTYQFMHGGFFHLLINMWFLIIFGGALEPILGSTKFLIFYLISGVVGALCFQGMSGLSAIPLVGASGCVSGLMGLFTILNWKSRVRFMYWLLPIPGYTGFVNLPAWSVLVVWTLSDIAGLLSTLMEFGGVAHAAHLGGVSIGILYGLWSVYRRKTSTHSVLSHAAGF